MKKRVKSDYSSIDIFKFYIERTGNPDNLSQKEFTRILKKFYNRLFDVLIFKGSEFTMPYKLGNIRVRKQKIKFKLLPDGSLNKRGLRPDWGATRKLWISKYPDKTWKEIIAIKDKPLLYHENKHSDRYSHGWHWDKSTCLVPNNTAYSLDIARTTDRKLAAALKTKNSMLDYSLY